MQGGMSCPGRRGWRARNIACAIQLPTGEIFFVETKKSNHVAVIPPVKKIGVQKILLTRVGARQNLIFRISPDRGAIFLYCEVITMATWEKTKEFIELRGDMLDDLQARGLVGKQYTDKVEEYMRLWCWLRMLDEDIKVRGVYIEYQNGATQRGMTDNKSLAIATRVSSQMLAIWSALGFREQAISSKAAGGEDDEL